MRILVIDDDESLNRGICSFLNSNKFNTDTASNGIEGTKLLQKNGYDLILSDLQMPEMGGLELLDFLIKNKITIPIIIMTAFSSIESAVEAMKKGAEDYLTKPINLNELLIKIKKVVKAQALINENKDLKRKINLYELPEIIGESESIKELKELLKRISNDSSVPVYIYGKSGTGKELVARNIHFMSDRKDKPFTPINCATLSDDLMESELFGYVKGAFTGAIQNKIGLLESSAGGTIFLDEISEMSPKVQAKLLRVLQDRIVQPIGSNEMKTVDVRVVSASNQKLINLVEEKKFREDLFYRLNVIEVEVPSLSARRNDIPFLIKYFLVKYKKPNLIFTDEALETLLNYDWPGNIRELENLIRMLLVTSSNSSITKNQLPDKLFHSKKVIADETNFIYEDYKTAFNHSVNNFDKSYLEYHLKKNNFNISKTSESIELSRVSLHKKIQEYSIKTS
ncbi:MAG: sigma-54-dependent Fis family transcriptional regulator [Ignavibacteriae bacterium]|nr:sigma-54-dependent Fis family transcriptional regulator [Ignavibacteriota bacterium]